MPKAAHAASLAYIRRLCLTADMLHIETARLVNALAGPTLYTKSTKSLKPKRRRGV